MEAPPKGCLDKHGDGTSGSDSDGEGPGIQVSCSACGQSVHRDPSHHRGGLRTSDVWGFNPKSAFEARLLQTWSLGAALGLTVPWLRTHNRRRERSPETSGQAQISCFW